MAIGGPEFILGIIAIATFGGVLKTAVRARPVFPTIPSTAAAAAASAGVRRTTAR